MQINFDVPEHEMQAEIKKQMEKSIHDKISRILTTLFAEPRWRETGLDKGGMGTQLITELSESHLLSDKTQERIHNGIEKYLDKNLESVIKEAVHRRIKHEVGKIVFAMKLKDLIKEEQIDNILKM